MLQGASRSATTTTMADHTTARDEFDWYEPRNPVARYFGVLVRGQTYARLLYLFLGLPLGVAWFVFLVTGLSVGAGLSIVYIGLFILAGVVYAWAGLVAFERLLANGLLRARVRRQLFIRGDSPWYTWGGVKGRLANGATWRQLLFLFLRFPLGVLGFVIAVTTLAATAGWIASPVVIWSGERWGFEGDTEFGIWTADSVGDGLLLAGAGLLLLPLALHVCNGTAWLFARFAEGMLGKELAASPRAASYRMTAPEPMAEAAAASRAEASALVGATATDEAPPVDGGGDEAPELSVDVTLRVVRVGSERVELTPKEFDLLALMAQNPGRPFTRDELLDRIWRNDYEVTDRTIDTHVLRLRKKLGRRSDAIETVWGIGYRFSDEDDRA